MTRTNRMVAVVATLLGVGVAVGAGAAEKNPLATTLRGVVEDHVRAYNARDAQGVLRDIHTQSPDYDSTKAAMEQQFRDEPVTAQLVDFNYMGHDNEFAVVRMKLKIAGPPTSHFQNNVVDDVMLFHQENGTWKMWSDDVLGVEFVEFTPK
jgi:hypothetical protein